MIDLRTTQGGTIAIAKERLDALRAVLRLVFPAPIPATTSHAPRGTA